MMRLLGLVITLLLIGYLLSNQLKSASDFGASMDDLRDRSDVVADSPPRVPTLPEDARAFKEDLHSYIEQQTDKRAQEIEESIDN